VTSLSDSVIVWTVRQDAPEVQLRLPSYDSLLTDDERQRARRFVQEGDRARFVIGRALVRTMLSSYAAVPPRLWPIAIDERGRPELRQRPAGTPDLRFNLSHTPGLVTCGVTVGREIGVDVEHTGRRLFHDDIPERFFSSREVADLRARPEPEQPLAFFDYWTLKEAYIKARGLGLALPLGQFTFLLHGARGPRIEFAPELHDDPATWQFAQFWPTREHRLAVAVRRSGGDLPILVTEVVPESAE
jgi:4'-phosphopantetheinyl transferase